MIKVKNFRIKDIYNKNKLIKKLKTERYLKLTQTKYRNKEIIE